MAEAATVDSLDIQITATANKAIAALETLSKRLEGVAASLRETQKSLDAQTRAQEESNEAADDNSTEIVKVTSETKKMAAATNKAVGTLAKLARAFGRIMLYRAIRTIIKNIGAAIKEGLTNLEAYSREVGTAFAPAVDNLRKHVLLLKNAFATALRPVIEALIPIIIKIVDALAYAADFIAQVMSVLTGKLDSKGRYTKAILSDLQQSNKQAKELRRTLLGFDEINRLDGNTGSNENNSAGLMFEQADVTDDAKKVAGVLKDIWEKVKEIATAVGEFIAKNPWVLDLAAGLLVALKLLKTFSGVLSPILKIVEAIGLKGIAIIAIITACAIWGDKISLWFKKAINTVKRFFGSIKTDSVAANATIRLISDALSFVLEIIGTVSGAIYKLFHGDLHGALEDGMKLFELVRKRVVKIFIDVVNIVLGIFSDVVNAIASAWTWLHNKVFAPAINWAATALKNVGIWFQNLGANIKIAVVTFVKFLKERFVDAINSVADVINEVIEVINWATGSNLKPIHLECDTTALDEELIRLRDTKIPPITETLEVVGQWKEPAKLKLQIDTSGASRAVDSLGDKVNRLGKAVASVATTFSNTSNTAALKFNITKYASGGFPSVGSVFIAGESGPELVTNINGQTGVYNTDQMAAAMYNAMVSALQTMPRSGGGDIYLDGEVIYRNVVNRNNNQVRSTGRAALLT